jgi:hypothetical protein
LSIVNGHHLRVHFGWPLRHTLKASPATRSLIAAASHIAPRPSQIALCVCRSDSTKHVVVKSRRHGGIQRCKSSQAWGFKFLCGISPPLAPIFGKNMRGMLVKQLAILANLAMLLFVAYMFAEYGMPKNGEILQVVVFVAAPTLSLAAIWRSGRGPSLPNKEESTFELARKALRAKLRRLAEHS